MLQSECFFQLRRRHRNDVLKIIQDIFGDKTIYNALLYVPGKVPQRGAE